MVDVFRRFPDARGLYALLEVESTAPPDELRRAFLMQAEQWLPGATRKKRAFFVSTKTSLEEALARFPAICEAYAILSDPQARKCYDEGALITPYCEPHDESVRMDIFRRANAFFNAFHEGRDVRYGYCVQRVEVVDGKFRSTDVWMPQINR